MITHYFHQHCAIPDEVSPPEGRGIWQGMASLLPLFLVLECLFWLAYVFFKSTRTI